MAPMTRPPFMMGTPPMLGRTSPCSTAGAADQNAEPFIAISPSSFVGFRKLAAAMALACASMQAHAEERGALLERVRRRGLEVVAERDEHAAALLARDLARAE